MSGRINQPTSRVSTSQRVLACVLCQKRKVKCERKFPCASCIKACAQCVPASDLPRQRRQRFPERHLLSTIRKYEELLTRNNIDFEPLHHSSPEKRGTPRAENAFNSDEELPGGVADSSPATTVQSSGISGSKEFLHAMCQGFRDPNDDSDCSVPEKDVISKTWDQARLTDDYLLFGPHNTNVDLSSLHPEPAEVFRLWQRFLNSVNPLLRVVHVPTLQGRIIDSLGYIGNTSSDFEALMFSIYSMAVVSTMEEPGSSHDECLKKYQFGCQQALVNSRFLRCGNRECLTALFLYLVSVATVTDPRALSTMLGLAIRIVQRMGIHMESSYAKCGLLEGEMRRRLWWALTLFDNRIGQLVHPKAQLLSDTWDCRIPLNLNDSDLRPEMKELPVIHERPTEAIFAVVRGELGDFYRKRASHETNSEGDVLLGFETMMEDRYLKHCDPSVPIHYMTIWNTRSHMAKQRLIESYSKAAVSGSALKDTDPDLVASYAIRLLECDTKVMSSSLTEPYRWMPVYHFPLPAYIHLVNDLKKRPTSIHSSQAWEAMSDNYEAHAKSAFGKRPGNLFESFTEFVVNAWWEREAGSAQLGVPLEPPRIVRILTSQQRGQNAEKISTGASDITSTLEKGNSNEQVPREFDGSELSSRDIHGGSMLEAYMEACGQIPPNGDTDQFNWAMMDFGLGQQQGW